MLRLLSGQVRLGREALGLVATYFLKNVSQSRSGRINASSQLGIFDVHGVCARYLTAHALTNSNDFADK